MGGGDVTIRAENVATDWVEGQLRSSGTCQVFSKLDTCGLKWNASYLAVEVPERRMCEAACKAFCAFGAEASNIHSEIPSVFKLLSIAVLQGFLLAWLLAWLFDWISGK